MSCTTVLKFTVFVLLVETQTSVAMVGALPEMLETSTLSLLHLFEIHDPALGIARLRLLHRLELVHPRLLLPLVLRVLARQLRGILYRSIAALPQRMTPQRYVTTTLRMYNGVL